MVDSLGKDGQSSDETDGENHAVRIKDWRSTAVKKLLIFVDQNKNNTTASGNLIGGVRAFVRVRRDYGPISTRQAVAGLPRNFYDSVWFDSLSYIQQVQLRATAPIELPVTGTSSA